MVPLRARYYHFEFMDQNGVDMREASAQAVSPGRLFPALPFDASTNPAAGCFSDGLLTNGAAVALLYFGERYRTPNTVIYNAKFPLNPGPGSHNVDRCHSGVSATPEESSTSRCYRTFGRAREPSTAMRRCQFYTLTPPVPPPAARRKHFYGKFGGIDRRSKRWTGKP
jgi:hypothetical protein